MPRYYFHIHDGDTLVLDDDGSELANIETVKNEALQSARDLGQQDASEHFFTSASAYIAVCDDAGNVVLTQPIHVNGTVH
jgi:hypothetical protein